MFDPITIGAALIPILSHVVTRVTDHFTGSAKPQNTQEAIALFNAETEKLKALADLDSSDGAPMWVLAVKGLIRPFAAAVILTTWSYISVTHGISIDAVCDLASAAVFYLFGNSTMMAITRGKK